MYLMFRNKMELFKKSRISWWTLYWVDPYYLTFISEEIGYSPKVITAGRKINDEMSIWFTQEIIKKYLKRFYLEILIMGFTFKENCPDYRNTKVLDMYNELISYGAKPIIYDPLVDDKQIKENLKLEIINDEDLYSKKYKVIVVTLAHDIFKKITSEEWEKLKFSNTLIFDLKNFIGDSINAINF